MKKSYTVLILLLTVAMGVKSQTTQWAKSLQGTGMGTEVWFPKVHTDASGNIISVGKFKGTMDMDPGPGVTNMSSMTVFQNSYDSYVIKMDPSANLLWAKRFDCVLNDYATGVATDTAGNVYVAGLYTDTMDADPGPGMHVLRHGPYSNYAYYIVKLDANGNFVWAISQSPYTGMNTGNSETEASIKIDAFGNLWAASYMDGGGRCRITKYSSAGAVLLTKDIESSDMLDGRLSFDNGGNVILTGMFWGSADFDLGPGTSNLTATANYNGYILKMDPNLNFQWVRQLTSSTSPFSSNAIAAHYSSSDASGNIYVNGGFMGTVDFDPGAGVASDVGQNDHYSQYILKLTPAGTLAWVHTFVNNNGWDVALDGMTTDAQGNVYGTGWFSGTLDFNRKYAPAITLNAGFSNARHAFVLKMDNTGRTQWVRQMGNIRSHYAQGGSIALGSNSLIVAGTFGDTLNLDWGQSNTLKLGASTNDINNAFFVSLQNCFTDTTVTMAGTTLTASIGGATCQWKDCATGSAISGATNKSFTPTVNGSYRVVINNGGCMDSSECYTITGLDVRNKMLTSAAKAYPNPTTGSVAIVLGRDYKQVVAEVRTVVGELLQRSTYSNTNEIKTTLEGTTGIYFIRLIADGIELVNMRVLKQ